MFTPDQMVAAIGLVAGPIGDLVTVETLPGGYSWTTVLVTDEAGAEWIVRVAPRGGTMEPYDPAAEAAWIDAAARSVPAPEVLGFTSDPGILGAPFSVQTRTPGTVMDLAVVGGSDRTRYRHAFAEALGRLHRSGRASDISADDALSAEWLRMADEYRRIALHRHPGFEVALRWLRARMPYGSARAALCHGDFRFANITWSSPGVIGGVLDWERAWIGDPMADIAFTRQFSGWCCVDGDAVAVYEAESGTTVDEHRVAFGLRFERTRAYLSPLRVMRAIHEGRVSDPRLIAIAEAGEAGMWDLVAWGDESYLPPLDGGLPPVEGPDWTDAIVDPEANDHFTRHPRPATADPDDSAAVAAAVRSWAGRATIRRSRTWR